MYVRDSNNHAQNFQGVFNERPSLKMSMLVDGSQNILLISSGAIIPMGDACL